MQPEEIAARLAAPGRRGRRARIAVALVVLLGVAAYVALRPRAASGPRYRTARVARQELVVRVSAPGALEAIDPVAVPAPMTGRIARVLVEEDVRVAAGDLLATLDTDDLDAEVRRAVADVRQARAKLADATAAREAADAALARTQRMATSGLASVEQVELATTQQRRARAVETAARAVVDGAAVRAGEAQTRAHRVELRAPVAGTILRRDATPSASVRPDGTPLFVISPRLDVLRLVAEIDEADVGAVNAASTATFTVPAWPGRTFTAKLVRVRRAPSRTSAGVSYGAILEASDPEGVLRPGMTASVTLVVATRPNALVVPEAALRWSPSGEGAGRTRVYVLDGHEPRALTVTPGMTDGVSTEIAGELSLGTRVIVGLTASKPRGGLDLGVGK